MRYTVFPLTNPLDYGILDNGGTTMDVRQAEIEAWKWHKFFTPERRRPKRKRMKQVRAECNRINAERDAIRERGGHPDE